MADSFRKTTAQCGFATASLFSIPMTFLLAPGPRRRPPTVCCRTIESGSTCIEPLITTKEWVCLTGGWTMTTSLLQVVRASLPRWSFPDGAGDRQRRERRMSICRYQSSKRSTVAARRCLRCKVLEPPKGLAQDINRDQQAVFHAGSSGLKLRRFSNSRNVTRLPGMRSSVLRVSLTGHKAALRLPSAAFFP